MVMLNEEQLRWCEANHAEAVELLRTLGRIGAPSGHEERRAEFIRDWLARQGARGAYIDDALNVILPIGAAEEGPVAILMAHTDVVFPDEEALPLREEGDQLCAPGIGDDTANLVNLLMAAKYLLDSGLRPRHGLVIAANSCEEGLGNLKGSRRILEAWGSRVTEMISIDGDMDEIVSRAVGSRRMRVTIRTGGGHSYSDFGRANAIAQMAELICRLDRQQVPTRAKTTYNVGVIEGGTTVNSIPAACSMLYEFRSEDRGCLAEMEAQFDEAIREFRERGVSVEVEVVGVRPCAGDVDADRQAGLTRRMKDIMERYSGNEIPENAGSTDANSALALGIPAVTIGAAQGGGAHTREEWTSKSALLAGMKIALAAVLQYCDS